ncbi:MAG: Rod binding protein [Wolinella sp.]
MMLSSIDSSSALYGAQKVPTIENAKSDDEKLKEQTDAFEAIMVKVLLDTALKFDNPLYPKEAGHEIYESMYKEQLSQSLSGGFGYSDLLFNYLKEQQNLTR